MSREKISSLLDGVGEDQIVPVIIILSSFPDIDPNTIRAFSDFVAANADKLPHLLGKNLEKTVTFRFVGLLTLAECILLASSDSVLSIMPNQEIQPRD